MIGPNTTTCEGASHHELRLKLKWLPCIIRRLKGTAKRARKFASKGGDGPVLKGKGVDDSGVSSLIKGTYALLGLLTYFTAGEKEVRAWTIKKGWKAPQAAHCVWVVFEPILPAF